VREQAYRAIVSGSGDCTQNAISGAGIPRAMCFLGPAWARLCVLLAALFVVAEFGAWASDKSGVGPNTISVPKGPGSIEGLGESFQPTLNTGTAKYSVALKVPPGTAGHHPDLSLCYEGGAGNGPLGFGWQLPVPYLQRRTDEGVPTYGAWVGFARADTFINEMKEELVPLTNGFYFCKNEAAFIRYSQISNHWEGTLPNGTRLEFGLTDNGRIQDTNSGRVFSWLLEQEIDTHGNTIVYSYSGFPGDQNRNQKYLTGIAYGAGSPPWQNFHFVTLVYEDRLDWFEDCRSGFLVRTGKRLKRIIVGTQGPTLAGHLPGDFNNDGIPDNLVRSYELQYQSYAGTNTYWSLLASVQPIGAGGANSLPPASFGYTVCNPPDQVSAAGQIIGGTNEPPWVMDNALVDLVDLNGDGLPDILKTDANGGQHTAFLNNGELRTSTGSLIQWSGPVPVGGDPLAQAVNLQTTSPTAYLADMDGDGLADLVFKSAGGNVYYFPNQGINSWGPRLPMSIQDFSPPAPFGNADVRTADLDFDKRIDIIQSVADGSGADYRIWFNLGNQQYSSGITVPQSNGFMFSWPGVQIADFNGDRVPDIMRVTPYGVKVTAGLGYGRFAEPVFVWIPDYAFSDDQVARVKMVDVTGDGLADLVLERAAPGELWYWINLGNYTFSPRKVITGMPTGLSTTPAIRWADLNGNGTTDYIYADQSNIPRLQTVDIGRLINSGPVPNTLVAISNGIGRVTLIGYQPSTSFALADAAAGNPWPDPMPFPVQVVAAVTNLDSLGHQYITQFQYHNGYYDPVEKQFRGFARAEQIDLGDPTAPTLVTRSVFDTGRLYEAMKGKLLVLTEEQQDGTLFSAETNLWALPPVTLYTGTNGTNVAFAHPTAKVKIISELGQGTPRLLESDFAYDNYGNETTNADYGIVVNGDRTAFNDERITTTEYALNLNSWIIRHPSRQQIMDINGSVISRTEYHYDDETFSGNNFGLVTLGNLTLRREWSNPANASAYVKSARTTYDASGNPVTLLDPLGSGSGGAVDLSQGHARQISYDGQFHTYPVTETIYLGSGKAPLVFQAAYDAGFGTVTASYDFNTNQTTYGYDEFARLISIVKPLDTPAFPTVEYEYDLAVPVSGGGLVNFIETRQLDTPLGSAGPNQRDYYFISRQFVDGLGRKLMTKTETEPAAGSSTPRVVISEAVQFNARQKPSRILNPCFSLQGGSTLDDLLAFENIEAPGWNAAFHDSGSLVTLGLASAHATTTTYDATLREIQTANPDGTFRRKVLEPLVERDYDENQTDPASSNSGDSMVHYRDGLGRLIQVDENVRLNDDGTPSGAINTWTSAYQYDVNDQLTRITDSQNNIKTFTYDGLKRKTLMNDPDRGVMTFVYDDASNLTGTTDAKNQTITYTYDGVNRISTEDYHDEGQPFSANFVYDPAQPLTRTNRPDVAYFYDVPLPNLPIGDGTTATARNTRGTLAYVWDLSGEEHTSFDARGRVEWVVKRIPDPVFQSTLDPQPASGLISYRTGFQYDSFDRTTLLTYPDDDQISYQYNARNLLQRIPGGPSGNIISNIAYAPSSQMVQTDYGNSIRTTHAYDSRLRLNSLNTAPGQSSGTPLIAFDYAFDGVSNIKSISDQRPGSVVPSGNARRNTQVFGYDDLYRLTRAQYSFNVPGEAVRNDGEIDYRYDRIGNMLAQNSTIQQLDRGLPVANLGSMSYGGSAGRSGRTGRQPTDPPGPHALTQITQPSTNSPQPRLYRYDANGNMLVIDGLTNTWDFKDRLVGAENTKMRAEYTYDYTDRRISKHVLSKANPAGTNFTWSLTNTIKESFTTIYVGKYFEVREHDAPTKYVWNGNTRVAHVTGSLNTNIRVQRLRVYAGWNLCSLAVTAANALQQLNSLSATGSAGQGEVIQAAYKWDPGTSSWVPATSNETLPAGTVLWLNATTDTTLALTGAYTDPSNITLAPGTTCVPGAGLEAWSPGCAWSTNASFSKFDPGLKRWLVSLPGQLEAFSNLPDFVAPGEAFFAEGTAFQSLQIPDSALRIRYYHQDHLSSLSCLTDALGAVVEECEIYAFGHTRCAFQPRGVQEDYQFAQKERDVESGLHYFEARFLSSSLSRFTRVDPLATDLKRDWLATPQQLNLYSFCHNNPLNNIDPSGCITDEALEMRAAAAERAKASPNGTGSEQESGAQRILSGVENVAGGLQKFTEVWAKSGVKQFGKLAVEAAPVLKVVEVGSKLGNGMLEGKPGTTVASLVAGEVASKVASGVCVAGLESLSYGTATPVVGVICYGVGEVASHYTEKGVEFLAPRVESAYNAGLDKVAEGFNNMLPGPPVARGEPGYINVGGANYSTGLQDFFDR
jgi:RHS repeat-associated protein